MHLKRLRDLTLQKLTITAEITLIVLTSVVTLLVINEMSLRQQVLGMLSLAKEQALREIINPSAMLLSAEGSGYSWSTTQPVSLGASAEIVSRELLSSQRYYEQLENAVRMLAMNGTRSRVDPIAITLKQLSFARVPNIQVIGRTLRLDRPDEELIGSRPYLIIVEWPRYLSSDQLLALGIISSAILGSCIAGVRRKEIPASREVLLGLSAGFVTFLAIRGGKSVIILEQAGHPLAFNPYSTAFIGMLAGLFTEKVYHLLLFVADDFEARLRQAWGKSMETRFSDAKRPLEPNALATIGEAPANSLLQIENADRQ